MTERRYSRGASDDITNFYLEAARGRVEGCYTVHKFGYAEDVDIADGVVDVWDGVANDIAGKVNPYNWIEGGPVFLQISSTSIADVGVQVSGEGLDENWQRATGTATLNGQTPVEVSAQRNRIHIVWVSGPVAAVGTIYISDLGTPVVAGVPTDSTKIRAIVHPHAQQTQMAVYTVPDGHSMLISHGWAHLSKQSTTEAIITIYRREFGGVFRVVHTLALQTSGNSGDHRPYAIPIKFNGKEDIVYKAQVFSNSNSISAGFHAVVIKD